MRGAPTRLAARRAGGPLRPLPRPVGADEAWSEVGSGYVSHLSSPGAESPLGCPHFQEIPETLLRAGETSRPRCARRRGERRAPAAGWRSPATGVAPSSLWRARLWKGPRGRPAVCDWFSSTMPRPGAGSGGATNALAASPSPAKRIRSFGGLTVVPPQVAPPNLGAPKDGAK